jgi:HEAT repeat protein
MSRIPAMSLDLSPELDEALRSFEIGAMDNVIARHDPRDFEVLRQLVAGGEAVDPGDRQRAIYALGKWGDPAAVPDIIAVLPSLEPTQSMTAIEALGRLGTDEARAAVESYVSDPSPHVRKFVVEALARMESPAADDVIGTVAATDDEPWVRALASRRAASRKRSGSGS